MSPEHLKERYAASKGQNDKFMLDLIELCDKMHRRIIRLEQAVLVVKRVKEPEKIMAVHVN